jgi:hypothetical protein
VVPHAYYAPLFVPGNTWVYAVSHAPAGSKKLRKWRETCKVTRTVFGVVGTEPVIKATVACKSTGRDRPWFADTYIASATGLVNPHWWATDDSFRRAIKQLLGNPPVTSAHAHEPPPDDKDYGDVAKIPYVGPSHSDYAPEHTFDLLSHPDQATLPDKRSVDAWTVSYSYNVGSGGEMESTWVPGIGLVAAEHSGGGDDMFYESWDMKLVEFRPAPRPSSGN